MKGILTIFLVLAFVFGLSYWNLNHSPKSNDDEQSDIMTPTPVAEDAIDVAVCGRCEGSGQVATYSAGGCSNMSHYPTSDCGQPHHTDSCISSGSKTCPCCHGSGKKN